MINLENHIIYADISDVLNILKNDLEKKGISRFNIINRVGDNIQTNCPFHKDGQEKKPSFGINPYINKCHCFTCGWAGDIPTLISDVCGHFDNGKYGLKFLTKFNSLEIEKRPMLFKDVRYTEIQAEIPQKLKLSRRLIKHTYMYQRGLTDEIINDFGITYDKEKDAILFPVYDLENNLVFIGSRGVKTKFFELPKGLNKPIYALNKFANNQYTEAYIVESFFNCLTLWKFGRPAMALLGTGTENQYEILRKLPIRSYILAFDPDNAGIKAVQRFRKNVPNKIIKEIEYKEVGKDINDLQEDFLKLRIIF